MHDSQPPPFGDPRELDVSENREKALFTVPQGQYLAYIHAYTLIHRRPPAEADLQAYFRVAPPSIHQMVITLHRKGLIDRVPGVPRSIRVLVPVDQLPPLAPVS